MELAESCETFAKVRIIPVEKGVFPHWSYGDVELKDAKGFLPQKASLKRKKNL